MDFLLQTYINSGIDEMGTDKLPALLGLKFGSIQDGINAMGGALPARNTFFEVQEKLYQ